MMPSGSSKKTFYILFNYPLNRYYTTVEAEVHQDAFYYADHFWGTAVKKIMSSSQWWHHNRHKKQDYKYLPKHKAENRYDVSTV